MKHCTVILLKSSIKGISPVDNESKYDSNPCWVRPVQGIYIFTSFK